MPYIRKEEAEILKKKFNITDKDIELMNYYQFKWYQRYPKTKRELQELLENRKYN